MGLGTATRSIDVELGEYLRFFARAAREFGFFPAGGAYGSPQEAVLEEGIVFPYGPYTSEEEAVLFDVFRRQARRWEPKQCFYNAQVLALADPRLGYAEGYVFAHGLALALEHGWNFLPESGKPVDVTFRGRGERATCDPAKLLARASGNLSNAYRGVAVPADEIRRHWAETGRAESLLQEPGVLVGILERGFPPTWGRAVP